MLTSDLKLLLEALQDALEVVQLDVGEQHAVQADKQFGEACIRCDVPGEQQISMKCTYKVLMTEQLSECLSTK